MLSTKTSQSSQIICPMRSGLWSHAPSVLKRIQTTKLAALCYSKQSCNLQPDSFNMDEMEESRTRKPGGQTDEEVTMQTTFQIPQQHLKADPIQSLSCLKFRTQITATHKTAFACGQYQDVRDIEHLPSRHLQLVIQKAFAAKPQPPIQLYTHISMYR